MTSYYQHGKKLTGNKRIKPEHDNSFSDKTKEIPYIKIKCDVMRLGRH